MCGGVSETMRRQRAPSRASTSQHANTCQHTATHDHRNRTFKPCSIEQSARTRCHPTRPAATAGDAWAERACVREIVGNDFANAAAVAQGCAAALARPCVVSGRQAALQRRSTRTPANTLRRTIIATAPPNPAQPRNLPRIRYHPTRPAATAGDAWAERACVREIVGNDFANAAAVAQGCAAALARPCVVSGRQAAFQPCSTRTSATTSTCQQNCSALQSHRQTLPNPATCQNPLPRGSPGSARWRCMGGARLRS
jgi:hypothetical protein